MRRVGVARRRWRSPGRRLVGQSRAVRAIALVSILPCGPVLPLRGDGGARRHRRPRPRTRARAGGRAGERVATAEGSLSVGDVGEAEANRGRTVGNRDGAASRRGENRLDGQGVLKRRGADRAGVQGNRDATPASHPAEPLRLGPGIAAAADGGGDGRPFGFGGGIRGIRNRRTRWRRLASARGEERQGRRLRGDADNGPPTDGIADGPAQPEDGAGRNRRRLGR